MESLPDSGHDCGSRIRSDNDQKITTEHSPAFKAKVALAASGWLRLLIRQTDLAIEHFETSLRLNPLRKAPATFGIAVGHFFARRLEKAAAMLLLSLQEHPNWVPCLRFLASCYAHLGRLRDAQSIVEKLRQMTPVLIPSAEQWRIQEDREFYLNGLRLAVRQSA